MNFTCPVCRMNPCYCSPGPRMARGPHPVVGSIQLATKPEVKELLKTKDKGQRLMECRFEILKMRALRAHAEIVSGAYKLAERYHGTMTGEGKKLTEEELLKDKVDELNRHIQLMDELAENMAKD